MNTTVVKEARVLPLFVKADILRSVFDMPSFVFQPSLNSIRRIRINIAVVPNTVSLFRVRAETAS